MLILAFAQVFNLAMLARTVRNHPASSVATAPQDGRRPMVRRLALSVTKESILMVMVVYLVWNVSFNNDIFLLYFGLYQV
jgi:hypothetical protein